MVMVMAPPVALRPKSVPCGPRKTAPVHLDPVEQGGSRARVEGIIDVHGRGGIGVDLIIVCADPANADIGGGGTSRGHRAVEADDEVAQAITSVRLVFASLRGYAVCCVVRSTR